MGWRASSDSDAGADLVLVCGKGSHVYNSLFISGSAFDSSYHLYDATKNKHVFEANNIKDCLEFALYYERVT